MYAAEERDGAGAGDKLQTKDYQPAAGSFRPAALSYKNDQQTTLVFLLSGSQPPAESSQPQAGSFPLQ
jgi:hypothetical protein